MPLLAERFGYLMKRRVRRIAIGIALLALIVALVFFLWDHNATPDSARTSPPPGQGDSADPSPSSNAEEEPELTPEPSPVPVPVPAATSEAGEVGDEGDDLIIPFIAAEASSRMDPTTPLLFEETATGMALEDLTVGAFEFAENGMMQRGAPEIISAALTAIDDSATPPSAIVLVCLDYSAVDVVTLDGTSIKDPDAPNRVPTILELQEIEGRWLVAKRTFPDQAEC